MNELSVTPTIVLFAALTPLLVAGTPSTAKSAYGNLPLGFELNRGQARDPAVKFLARSRDYTISLKQAEAVLFANGGAIRMTVVGAHRTHPHALQPQDGRSNYFIGKDSTRWLTDIPHYSRVEYQGIYNNVNLSFYGTGRQLEYDWTVGPGGDVNTIRTRYDGVTGIKIDQNGDLILHTPEGELRHNKPKIYQEVDGHRRSVEGRFILRGRNEVGFQVASYDRSVPLTIDPILAYSTYIGGSLYDAAYGVAVDGTGSAYITGATNSANFPRAQPLESFHSGQTCNFSYYDSAKGGQSSQEPCADMFVTKLNPAGNGLVYSTYIGGSNDDGGTSIAVDSSGSAYITGGSSSTDFPTVSPYQSQPAGGGDVVLLKLNAAGNTILFSTYLGGSMADLSTGVAIDGTGIYLTGVTFSTNFPTKNKLYAYSGMSDGFITKFNLFGTSLIYSTFIGGPGRDQPNGISVDSNGNAYIAGEANAGFPTTANAYQSQYNGNGDAFITAVNSTGTGLIYSTFLGGDLRDYALAIRVDSAGTAYISGETESPSHFGGLKFPTTPGAFQPNRKTCTASSCGDYGDAFVAKLSPQGGLVASTLLGGTMDFGNTPAAPKESKAYGVAFDQKGNIFAGGYTVCTDFPNVHGVQLQNAGGEDVFIVKLDSTLSNLLFSTYFGGSGDDWGYAFAIDSAGGIYMVGYTTPPRQNLSPFPSTAPGHSLQTAYGGGRNDAFIVKLANADLALTFKSAQAHALTAGTAKARALSSPMSALNSVVSPGGTLGLTATITNQTSSGSSDGADNVMLTPSLPRGSTLSACSYGAGSSCLGSNGAISMPGLNVASGSSVDVNLTVQLDSSWAPGDQFTATLHTHSDTNDPDPSNNLLTISAVVGVTVQFQSSPLSGFAITIDGSSPQTTPFTASIDGSTTHTFCTTSPQTVNGTTYIFSNWTRGAAVSASICQSNIGVIGGTFSAAFSPCSFALSSNSFSPGAAATSSTVNITAGGSCPWTATSDVPWITITSGQSGTGNGAIGFSIMANPGNAPRTGMATIGGQTLTVTQAASGAASFYGYIDTPVDKITSVAGAIGVTGWAIGTGGVQTVGVWREPVGGEPVTANGLVFLGNASIISGSRPDVARAYPGYPQNDSGWGFQILTNGLPNTNVAAGTGNGTYRFHVIAANAAGQTSDLGVRTMTVDNAHSQLPFGAIDTPAQGGTASGTIFVNFGWAVTPNSSNVIPKDGSTITVYIDNHPVGHPAYNFYRSDIASGFPGLQNSNGAVGYYVIDTTKLANGLHTISWSLADSAGNAQGIGSRYFTVRN